MNQGKKNIIYIAALLVIIFPILMEQFGTPMSVLMQTVTLLIGLLILFIGKMQVITQKKRAGMRPASHDTLTLAIILFMAAYVLYQYFV